MCGFDDVRLRADGQYVCSVCGKKLGKDFLKRVTATQPAKLARKLKCSTSKKTS